jgi:hypothetical protein
MLTYAITADSVPDINIFALVFIAACLAVLWKLRKTGKIYSFLFKVSLVAVFLFLVGIIYTIIANLLA